jgi:membrane protein DedA with SNARE-associated domain
VIFCETGLVVMPFLPGDSLLFIAGAVAAGGGMDPVLLGGLLMLAAILGDSTNYVIGRTAGERCSATRTRKSSAATTCKKPTTSMTSTAAKP